MKLLLLILLCISVVLADYSDYKYCDLGNKLSCREYLLHKGKYCSAEPYTCWNKDPKNNTAACDSITEGYCTAFVTAKGYLCSDFYCLMYP